MSDYTPSGDPTDGTTADATELSAEFILIQTAVNSKADETNAVLVTPNIGTPSAGTLTNCTGLPISTGVSGLGTGIATALAVNVGSAGAPVTFNGAGGTPTSMVGTNITGTAAGLTAGNATTAAAVAVGGITGLGAGVGTFLATASSANLAAAVSDETGSGALVFAESPTLVTPKSSTTIGVGNATPSASGAGITFPATQSASTDANTLDDYEEGTWTPVLSCTTVGDLSITYSSQSGTYTKIGRMVVVNCIIATSAFTHTTASSTIKITGLPFTPASQYLGSAILEDFAKGALDMWVCAFTPGGGNAYMYLSAARDGGAYRNLDITDFPSGSTPGIRFTVTYFV